MHFCRGNWENARQQMWQLWTGHDNWTAEGKNSLTPPRQDLFRQSLWVWSPSFLELILYFMLSLNVIDFLKYCMLCLGSYIFLHIRKMTLNQREHYWEAPAASSGLFTTYIQYISITCTVAIVCYFPTWSSLFFFKFFFSHDNVLRGKTKGCQKSKSLQVYYQSIYLCGCVRMCVSCIPV